MQRTVGMLRHFGRFLLAEESSHYIHLDAPYLVSQVVLEMLDMSRA